MTDQAVTASPVETKQDYGDGPDAVVKRWLVALSLAEKEDKTWHDRARKVVERYRDQRETVGTDDTGPAKMNLLYSNVETLKPALYARTPRPQVERRFKDADPVGRVAAQVLERTLSFLIDAYDFDGVMRACVEDYLLPGRGQARVRYVPSFGDPLKGEDGQPLADASGQPVRQVVYEEARCEYVYWEDFRIFPCRRWSEAKGIAFRVYMTREQLVSRFGKEIGEKVPLDYTPKGLDADQAKSPVTPFKQATVWEIWDADAKQAIWVSPGYTDRPLDTKPAPLDLHGFFPCPRPLTACTTNDTTVPIPDFCQYQDQANEVDELTGRIQVLTKALRLVGAYDATAEGMEKILHGEDNQLVPVQNWARFAEKGGMDGAISWVPIKEVAETLMQLYNARAAVKQDLYEVTGVADIIRGSSNANETATAQKIKGRFASLRLQDRQKAVAEFARDLIRLKAEIVAEHFSKETLVLMTGIQLPTAEEKQAAVAAAQAGDQSAKQTADMPSWDEVIALLRNDGARSFRIDIETDSTIQPDEQEDKQAVTELLTAIATFLKEALPLIQAGMPASFARALLLHAVRRYQGGRDVEAALESAFDQIEQAQAKAQQQPPQDPKAAEATQRLAFEQQKHEDEMAFKREQAQLDRQHQADIEAAKIEDARAARQEALDAENRPQLDTAAAVQRIAEIAEQGLGQMAQQIEQLGQVVAQIAHDTVAPIELIPGPDGKVAAVRKGSVVRPIQRDPRTRRVTGLQ